MSQSASRDLADISVLCVDDDPVIRSVVRSALQNQGCNDVVAAHGAADALDLCAGREFDLLICDFQMTPMTGLDFLRELAKDGLARGRPVIMLSAESDPETIETARALGVTTWVAKPVSVRGLIEQVTAVLGRGGHGEHGQGGHAQGGHAHGGRPRQAAAVATSERSQAHLLAALRAAEEAVRGLNLRPRETVFLVQRLHSEFDDITEVARGLGYELVTMLTARALDLVAAMATNPVAAARGRAAAANALLMLITAMQRVALNRMAGDGAVAGLKLLEQIDRLVAPVRAALRDRTAD